MALDASGTITDRFAAARSVLDLATPRRRRVGRTYQGYVKALLRHGATIVPALQAHLRTAVRAVARSHWTRFGWVLFAVDGTKIDCVRSEANEIHLGVASKARGAPQQLLTSLWHMGTGLPWAWIADRADASEREHLRRMMKFIPAGAMVVSDAGFTGFDLLRTLQDAGMFFLVRVGAGIHLLRKLGYDAEERHDTVYLWPATRRDCPPLVLRLIRIPVGPRRAPICLITNVHDVDRLDDETAGVIYRMRWGVEVFHRSTKETLQRRKMRSAAPRQATQELHWTIIGLLLLGLVSVSAIVARGKDPLSWSVASALRVVRQALHRTTGSLRTLMRRLGLATKDDYVRRNPKHARDWPHKKTSNPPGRPKVRTASPQEVQRARQLADDQANG